jgi:4-amino-4-deoxy-L-arabinose transferase-like glycosyltransferase
MNIKKFLSNKYNWYLIGILLFALILRLLYLTINKSLWWDEAEYLSIAKYWAFGVKVTISILRAIYLPAFFAFLYKLGANELTFRILEVIISLGAVYGTYLLGKEMYNEKVGLISSFIMSFFWLSLFYTARIMVDIPVLTFSIFTLYFFWVGYVNKKSKYNLWLMGLFGGLAIMMKFTAGLIVLIILIYLVINEKLNFLKNKQLWISALIGFLTMLPYFIFSLMKYKTIGIITAGGSYTKAIRLKEYISQFPDVFYSPIPYFGIIHILLILFLIGLVLILINLIIGFDLIKSNTKLKSDLMNILVIFIVFIYHSFFVGLVESRYIIFIFPSTFFIMSNLLIKLYYSIHKYHKYIAIGIIIFILGISAYQQISYANSLIKYKALGQIQLKEAGLWIKENSNKNDIIFNSAWPQNTYYSERETISYNWFNDSKQFNNEFNRLKPKYIVISGLERQPTWSLEWVKNNQDKLKPVQVYYLDEEKKQPILIIYETEF